MREIKVGNIYKHFKDKYYIVIEEGEIKFKENKYYEKV